MGYRHRFAVVSKAVYNTVKDMNPEQLKAGSNSVQMVRCNNCMSVFPESKTPYDPETLTEYCPICRKDGCLMDVEV